MNHIRSLVQKQILLIMLIVLSFSACSSLKPAFKRTLCYSLEYDPPKMDACMPISAVIRVERFRSIPPYNSTKIVYRENAFQREAYVYHKWWAMPADMVTYFLARDFRHSACFKAVFAADKGIPATHVIEGIVEDFFEHESSSFSEAVLSISIALIIEDEPDISKRMMFQKKYSAKNPCIKGNPASLAQAMSQSLSDISLTVIADVYHALLPQSHIP